jgi:transcription termination factor Rho
MAKATKTQRTATKKATREHKRVAGVVDRIEGNIVVVVIRDPNDPECTREIYVPRDRIKKIELQEGDRVTVLLD